MSLFLIHANARRAIDPSPYQTPYPNSNGAAIVLLYRSPEIGLERIALGSSCSIANRYYATVVYIRVLVDDWGYKGGRAESRHVDRLHRISATSRIRAERLQISSFNWVDLCRSSSRLIFSIWSSYSLDGKGSRLLSEPWPLWYPLGSAFVMRE